MRIAALQKCLAGVSTGVIVILWTTPARSQSGPFLRSTAVTVAETLDGAVAVAAGDLNRDGKPDIVVGSHLGVHLLLGSGSGTFQPATMLLPNIACDSVVLADFDHDGNLDVAAYTAAQKTIYVLKGRGDGAFGPPSRLATLQAPQHHAVGAAMIAADLNRDGIPDLAAAQGSGVCQFIGNGDASFQPCAVVDTGSEPRTVLAADFNADNIPDLATTNAVTSNVSIMLGAGKGLFQPPQKIGVGSYGMGMAASDWNQDGVADLAVATQESIAILLGNGDGTFRSGAVMSQQQEPLDIVAGDWNRDGIPDLAFGNYYGGALDVLLGYGNGTFRISTRLYAEGDLFALAAADMNGDSKPDLLAASHSSGTALLAIGSGDGKFEWPSFFGDASYSFLRAVDANSDGKPDLLAVMPLRKSVSVLNRGVTPMSFPAITDYPFDAQFGDFNRDKVTDVVVATVRVLGGNPGDDFGCRILFFPGKPGGGFGAAVVTPIDRCPMAQFQGPPLALAAGDFTGDGIPDLAVANNPLGSLQLYRGRGDGTFQVQGEVPESSIKSLAAADFDGDGIPDVALTHAAWQSSSYLLATYSGTAAGEWKKGQTLTGCTVAESLVALDVNGDSKPDIAVGCGAEYLGQTKVTVFVNSGGGIFRPGQDTLLALSAPPLLAAADFDGDGKRDLIALERWGFEEYRDSSLGVLLLGNGDGSFRASGVLAGLPGPAALAADFWNDDGALDIALLGGRTGEVVVMANNLSAGIPGDFAVVSAASLAAGPVAPTSIAAGFGKSLSDSTATASETTLPTRLAGVTLTFTDSLGLTSPASLIFVSPAQVNFVVPVVSTGPAVATLNLNGKTVAQSLVQILPFAPGIFTANADGKGVPAAQALRVTQDGSRSSLPVFQCGTAPGSCASVPIDLGPATDRVYLSLYATGVRNCSYTTVQIGGIDAQVTGSQAQGQFPGLDQVNLLLPRLLEGKGEVPLTLSACGTTSNTVRITIR